MFEVNTDGFLVIRYLFGFAGPELTTDAIGIDCHACDLATVLPILDEGKSSGWLDIDGDGNYDALTDGLLVMRYLLGVSGPSLIDSAVAFGCSRCTADAVINHLNDFGP